MNFNVNKTNMVKCIAIILMLMHHLFYCSKTFCEQYGTYSKFITWDSVYLFCGAAKICVGIFVVTFFQRLRQLFIDIRIHIVVAVHKAEIIAGGQINTHIAGGGSPAVFFMMHPDSVILIRQPLTELIRTVR